MNDESIVDTTQNWVQNLVVDLNLCPFAKRELTTNRIHFTLSHANSEQLLLEHLQVELEQLNNNPSIETTLLIHPNVLQDFYDYNQFLDYADALLVEMDLEGIYQIASFHPNYQFADTEPNDAENYTNKSPYPMLHLLREDSIEHAITQYLNPESIHQQNISLLNKLGSNHLKALLAACQSRK